MNFFKNLWSNSNWFGRAEHILAVSMLVIILFGIVKFVC